MNDHQQNVAATLEHVLEHTEMAADLLSEVVSEFDQASLPVAARQKLSEAIGYLVVTLNQIFNADAASESDDDGPTNEALS